MEIFSCNKCSINFTNNLSFERHNKVLHRTKNKNGDTKSIDYSNLDISLMRKINALLGIPMPNEIENVEKVQSNDYKMPIIEKGPKMAEKLEGRRNPCKTETPSRKVNQGNRYETTSKEKVKLFKYSMF